MKITTSTPTNALQGVRNSLDEVQKAAEQIAATTGEANRDASGLPKAVVDLKQTELQGRAALKVLDTENQILGSLLDTRA